MMTFEERQAIERLTRKSHISEVVLQPDEMTIQFVNTDASVMNAIRRVAISEVPTIAIEKVCVRVNTSPLAEEYISHRLGLIPLVSENIDDFKYPQKCTCIDTNRNSPGESFCENCAAAFTIDVTNDRTVDIDVTSDDMSIQVNPYNVYPIHHPALSATSSGSSVSSAKSAAAAMSEREYSAGKSGIVIAKLASGQRIDLDCIARKGIGKDHAKWSPVCCSVFRYTPVVYVNDGEAEKLSEDMKEKFDGVCPRGIIKMERGMDGKFTGRVVLGDAKACNYCNECVQFASINKVPDLVRVEDRPGMFEYYVESTGVMSPEKIVSKAFNVIIDKLKVIRDELDPDDG